MFNSQTYMLTVMKGREDYDEGITGASSPPAERIATGSFTTTTAAKAAVGAGVYVGKRALNVATSNIKAITGSSMQAERWRRTSELMYLTTATLMLGPKALVITAVAKGVEYAGNRITHWQESQEREANRRLRGMAVTNGQGSAYYG